MPLLFLFFSFCFVCGAEHLFSLPVRISVKSSFMNRSILLFRFKAQHALQQKENEILRKYYKREHRQNHSSSTVIAFFGQLVSQDLQAMHSCGFATTTFLSLSAKTSDGQTSMHFLEP